MPDWDAEQYHRLSDPQHGWGLKVLDRLQPAGDERILDIGCGTGRLTAEIRKGAPRADVTAIDPSWSMVSEARRHFGDRIRVVQADGTALPFGQRFDAVFSTAAFHWIPDHPRLFSEIHRVLEPAGRLVSQAGGGPNLSRLYERTRVLAEEPDFAEFFAGWRDPWYFAGVSETKKRLADAGFIDVNVWLEAAPISFDAAASYGTFVTTVCLRHQLGRLPEAQRTGYLECLVRLASDDQPPFTLDYWRLNIDARKR